jgi:purine-nucleoside phosphorylase
MSAAFFLDKYKAFGIDAPALHVVLGSGLSGAFDELSSLEGWKQVGQIRLSEIPEVSASTAPGHLGALRYFRHQKSGKALCFQLGRLHGYEGLTPRQVVAPLMAVRSAGTQKFLLTNASGGLQTSNTVGSIMIITDHVNLTAQNPLYGKNPCDADGKPYGPRFPDMSEVYNRDMRSKLSQALKKHQLRSFEGVYLGLQGPSYETPAEIRLFASWGMGAVGMSTVWEAIALRHSGAELAGLSVISNFGAGLLPEPLKHEDVEAEVKKIGRPLVESLFEFGSLYAGL